MDLAILQNITTKNFQKIWNWNVNYFETIINSFNEKFVKKEDSTLEKGTDKKEK